MADREGEKASARLTGKVTSLRQVKPLHTAHIARLQIAIRNRLASQRERRRLDDSAAGRSSRIPSLAFVLQRESRSPRSRRLRGNVHRRTDSAVGERRAGQADGTTLLLARLALQAEVVAVVGYGEGSDRSAGVLWKRGRFLDRRKRNGSWLKRCRGGLERLVRGWEGQRDSVSLQRARCSLV